LTTNQSRGHSAKPAPRHAKPANSDATPSQDSTVPTFGAVLRAIRERRRLTRSALAEMMGQSVSYVSLLESGQRRATERVLTNLRFAIALTTDEEAELAKAAHIPDPIAQMLQYDVSTLGAQAGADEFHRALIQEDMGRTLRGYLALLRGYQHLNANQFRQARDQLEAIVSDLDVSALPPTIPATANVWLADVSLKQGDPGSAKKAIGDAHILLDRSLRNSVPLLHAEAQALSGMINLRTGDYSIATDYFQFALDLYRNVLATDQTERAAAAIGLTKSYNRLALLALLKGDPKSADSYCVSALDALTLVSPDSNDLTDPRRLRLLALQAWAYVEEGLFEEARQIRERTLAAYGVLDDEYGLAKTSLYMADDARLEIQAHVEPDETEALTSSERRYAYYHKRLNAPAIRRLIARAREDYERAIAGLERLGEALLLSRAYRGLGDVYRYEALSNTHSGPQQFAMSRQHLLRAIDLETKAAQDRRKAGTLESLAKLEWDQGHLAATVDLFTQAIELLTATSPSEDEAARKLLKRCTLGLQAVKSELGTQRAPHFSFLVRGVVDTNWETLTRRLAQAVADAILREHATPTSNSSLTLEWTRQLYDLDQRQGARLVLQGALSTSHEKAPLQGLGIPLAEHDIRLAAELHLARFYACESRIREAHEGQLPELAYIDMCEQRVIEDGILRDPHTRWRAVEALRRLEDTAAGYQLIVATGPMPIHFFFKGDTALAELTYDARTLDPRLVPFCRDPNSETCFALHGPALIQTLNEVFYAMKSLAEQGGHTRDWTVDWLRSRLELPTLDETSGRVAIPAL
jgi:transcriptional regulator with XRE-family HTH domain